MTMACTESVQEDIDLAGRVDVEAEVVRMLGQEHKGLWSKIYQSHGAFLYELNESGTAYRTLLLAQGLEEVRGEMVELITPEEEEADVSLVVFAATISMLLLVVLLILILRRVHGSKRNRITYRAKQKEGNS